MSQGGSDWAAERTAAAQEHQARLHARQSAEHAKAGAILAEFVSVAATRLPAQPLVVQGYGGRGSARSNVDGWYLRVDKTVGVGTDGEFYVLTAALSLMDRLRGVRLRPTPPPLVIGAGGKDGDTIDLVDALERLLPQWRSQSRQ
ncbi:MAG: hypothetical protein ACK5H2_03005 [Beutenbergiaceae bacterium]